MTGVPAGKADLPGTYFLEFGCERRCQVEVDLSDVHLRYTHRQMLDKAKAAHEAAHSRAERVYRFTDSVIVRASLVGAS